MRLPLFRAVSTALLCCFSVAAAAQTIDRIRDTGQLRLGFRADAAPLSFADAQGRPSGYSPLVCAGVAQSIANQLNMSDLNATFLPVDTKDRFEKVANGDIDILCGAATITLARREIVDFSSPTYVDGTAVALPAGANPDLAALAGKSLGVRAGTTTEQALANSLSAAGLVADTVTFSSHADGLRAMEAKEIDAYFADQSILLYLFSSSDMAKDFQVSNEILTIEKHGLALPRGDSDFRLMVDRALSDLFASGEMERIFVESLPGSSPGVAIKAMFLLSPTIP